MLKKDDCTHITRRRIQMLVILLIGMTIVAALVVVVGVPANEERTFSPNSDGRRDFPLLKVVYSSDAHGFLEPCQCTSGQLGGLARRATLVKRLKQGCQFLLLIDGGAFSPEPTKIPYFAKAYGLIGYDVVGVDPLDAKDTKQKEAFLQTFKGEGVRVTSLTLADSLPDSSSNSSNEPTPFEIIRLGRRRVGVLSIAPFEGEKVYEQGQRLKKVSSQLQSLTDALIVMSRMGKEFDSMLAEVLSGSKKPILILSGPDEGKHFPSSPQKQGNLLIGNAGDRGMYLLVVDLAFSEDGSGQILKAWVEAIREEEPEEPAIAELVERYYAGERMKIKERAKQRQKAKADEVPLTERAYAPSKMCATCHQQAYQIWRESLHAKAVMTLKKKDRLVAECLVCHSEEFRRTGYFDPLNIEEDDGVNCTTCHGEGRIHSLTEDKKFIKLHMSEKECVACHNPEQQIENFDYKRNLEKIRHW